MNYDLRERLRLNLRDYYFFIKGLNKSENKKGLVYCNSFPKSGTHLLSQILVETGACKYVDDIVSVQSLSGVMNDIFHIESKIRTYDNNSLVKCHLSYSPKISSVIARTSSAHFFMYRDLRDVAVSHANWVLNEPEIYLHKYYKENFTNFSECLMASIQGVFIGDVLGSNISNTPIGRDFSRWLPWLNDESVMPIRFEDLVGARGGGSEEKRLELVADIHRELDLDIPLDLVSRFGSEAMNPNKSHTFRKGRKGSVGGWRDVFESEHKDVFKKVAGNLLIDLGYESDNNW